MNSESDLTDHFLDLDLDVDIRIQEIHSLKAIFPHTLTISDEFSGSIEIPIEVDSDIEVTSTNASKDSNARILNKSLSKFVKNLPPINLLFSLPESYPENEPPVFRVESQIISKDQISQLSTELLELWATYKDQVLFSMVDHIQERLISLTPARIDCQLDLAKFDSIITFNSSALLSQFNSQTYTCQICQEDYKGSHCSQFPSTCKHIFCNNCLYDYFSSLILTGEISKVHCPDYECTKAHIKTREKYLRVENLDISTFDFNDFKKNIMTPPISIDFLGKILIKETENPATTTSSESASTLLQRYNDLFVKQQYEVISKLFPARLVSCPRTGCEEQIFRENLHEPLVICRKCNFAFCNWCRKSWHGTLNSCSKKGDLDGKYSDIPVEALEMWLDTEDGSKERIRLGYLYGRVLMKKMADEYLMDKLFKEMLDDESQGLQKCPTCDTIIQRKDGCNKMLCSTCATSFCNLCGVYLEREKPYDHFKDPESSCYGRLFQGMPGLEEPQVEYPELIRNDE